MGRNKQRIAAADELKTKSIVIVPEAESTEKINRVTKICMDVILPKLYIDQLWIMNQTGKTKCIHYSFICRMPYPHTEEIEDVDKVDDADE